MPVISPEGERELCPGLIFLGRGRRPFEWEAQNWGENSRGKRLMLGFPISRRPFRRRVLLAVLFYFNMAKAVEIV